MELRCHWQTVEEGMKAQRSGMLEWVYCIRTGNHQTTVSWEGPKHVIRNKPGGQCQHHIVLEELHGGCQ